MSALSPMLAAWYASSPEPTSNHQAPDYGSGVGSTYQASAVAAAVAAAAAAAAVSSSGPPSSVASGTAGGLALANATGVSAMHQATSLTSNYHSSVMSSMGYSDRAYENQMGGHCQTNSYSAYQPPPSPYRPHPVSPPTHHQSPYGGTPGAGQMHLPSISYSTGHQLSPYSTTQGHYGPSPLSNQDVYHGRSPPIYGSSPNAHLLQQSMKPPPSGASSPWAHPGHDNSNNGDLLYQGQSSASRSLPPPSHLSSSTPSSPMPPPPMRSPPVSMSTPVGHYHRQMPPSNSSPSHSPHQWPQTGQIPSPSGAMLHSPRTTPSPLPNHGRSPGHTPFSPPPASATPSPHHHHASPMVGVPPSPMTAHHQQQQQQQSCKTPPTSGSTSPPPSQNVSAMGSPSQPSGLVGGPSDPLQSLQKMVMLDSEMVDANAAVVRGQYEMNQSHSHPHPPPPPSHQPHHQQHHPATNANRPSSYFSSVENLAGNDPGSPYPTYYNLDQNRLCTPPRAGVSTPTSSTFTSAQDSASNSSVSVESYPVVVDSSHQLNGDMVSQHQRVDCNPRPGGSMDASRSGHDGSDSMVDCGMSNGNSNEMISYDIPGYAGKKKYAKGVRGRRGSPSEFGGVNQGDKDMMMYGQGGVGPMGVRKPYPGSDGTNGQMEYYPDDRVHLGVMRKRGRGSRFAGAPRWGGRMLVEGENELGGATASAEEVSGVCSLDEGGMYLSLALKRGQRKKRTVVSPGTIQPPMGENLMDDPRYNDPSLAMSRSPRARGMRSPRGSGRRSRRRAGGGPFSHFVNERPPFDGGFLDSSGNATDGMREASYLGTGGLEPGAVLPTIRDPTMMGGVVDEENMHDGAPFLKSGMLETPRSIPPPPPPSTSQDLQFGQRNPQVTGNVPPNHMQDGIGVPPRADDYYSQQSYPGEPAAGMPMGGVSYPGQPQVERKRGRPRGSKNKPKQPGEENSPIKKTPPSQQSTPTKSPNIVIVKKEEPATSEPDTPFLKKNFKGRTFLGPVIRMTGTREKPLSVEVVNFAVTDEVKETSKVGAKQKRPIPTPMSSLGSSMLARKKLGVLGHSSTLSPLYDAFTRDRSWVCSLCHKNSHYRGLGDLFGPYFSSEDQQRIAEAAASATPTGPYSSGVPTPTSIPENEESNKVWDSSIAPVSSSAAPQANHSPLSRQVRGKRKRSDASEECLKSTLLKRAKQGKKSSSILGIAASTASAASSLDGHPSGEIECTSSISMAASGHIPIGDTSHSGIEYWVHEDCAIWSQGVYLVRQQVRGLDEAVKEAAEMICCKCKLNGATLGCFSKGCTEQYHFICAKDRGCEMDELNFSMLCPKHKQYKTKTEIKQEDCSSSCNAINPTEHPC